MMLLYLWRRIASDTRRAGSGGCHARAERDEAPHVATPASRTAECVSRTRLRDGRACPGGPYPRDDRRHPSRRAPGACAVLAGGGIGRREDIRVPARTV